MPFTRIQTSNADVNRLQDSVVKVINPLEAAPLTGGSMVSIGGTTKIALGTGQNNVAHGLQRVPSFFIITYLDANTAVWSSSPPDVNNLYLSVSANCTISLWVN